MLKQKNEKEKKVKHQKFIVLFKAFVARTNYVVTAYMRTCGGCIHYTQYRKYTCALAHARIPYVCDCVLSISIYLSRLCDPFSSTIFLYTVFPFSRFFLIPTNLTLFDDTLFSEFALRTRTYDLKWSTIKVNLFPLHIHTFSRKIYIFIYLFEKAIERYWCRVLDARRIHITEKLLFIFRRNRFVPIMIVI